MNNLIRRELLFFFFFFFFFFFEIAQSLITLFIAGNLMECLQVQLTLKISRFFDT